MPLPLVDPEIPVGVVRKTLPSYAGFHHLGWYVGNARQAATYYVTRFGFEVVAYRGPETGSPLLSSYVVKNGGACLSFTAPLVGPHKSCDKPSSEEDRQLVKEIHDHLTKHGDGVKDIAFEVDDQPTELAEIKNGKIISATITTFGDTTHTFINRSEYQGSFLPGYKEVTEHDPVNVILPKTAYIEIDHCVGNQPWNGLDQIVQYYENALNFHRYWSVDDKDMCSDYSAMRSIVVSSPDNVVKMPLNEPAVGLKKSQIEEFVDYYNGAGCQHIAFRTHDIVSAVKSLNSRGVKFLSVPPSYYTAIQERLAAKGVTIAQDINLLQKYNILIDFDEGGYLLQIFAKHVLDRPTVFIEIIQRENFDGFGAGNFKSLFEAFEREQELRGNL
ncbi:uncharacterized protein PFLUO_LOCUS344 [Penicillium psychrofluorescens]|uniref:uncharacterized protein n=1 Tax=Penicillium psychrofluorescens TaxID=3158075 RepID=UPI003CCD2F97